MSPKSTKFAQRLQEAQRFVAARLAQDAVYPAIAHNLAKMNATLEAGKLNLHICSHSPSLAQALKNSLTLTGQLPPAYQLAVVPFPEQLTSTTASPSARLTLRMGSQQAQYLLPTAQTIAIGRRPGCPIQIPDQYERVSGHHAEIRSNADQTWEICDLNSRNGTYVNGQRLQDCQTLKAGDRITLTSPTASEKSPELLFEAQPAPASEQTDTFQQHLAECDVLCVVISSSQNLAPEEQQFLEVVSQAPLARLFVVMDAPRSGEDWQAENLENAAAIANWIKTQNLQPLVEHVSLSLRLFSPESQGGTLVDPGAQPDLVQFCQSLENLAAKDNTESFLIKRLTNHLLQYVSQIECVITNQEMALNRMMQETELSASPDAQSDLKERTRKAIRKANDERDKFFRQVRLDLNQAKTDVLDKHRKTSILNKIQTVVASFQGILTQQGNQTYLQLIQPGSKNRDGVNHALIHLCRSDLIQWGTEEWRAIRATWGEGGLLGLLRRLYTTLNVVPALELTESLSQPIEEVPIDRYLDASVVDLEARVPYKDVSLAGYLFKSTKSQVTGIVSLISLVAIPLGLNINKGSSDSGNTLGFYGLMLGVLIPVVMIFLTYSYYQEKSSKLREEEEKLKDKVSSSYQDLAKGFVDRLTQALLLKLDTEERRLKDAIELVNEQFVDYLSNLDKQQVQSKSRLAELKLRQAELKKEKSELEKVKLNLML